MQNFKPAYIKCYQAGRLKKISKLLSESLSSCYLCPRECGVNRLSGKTGICQTGEHAWVSSYAPHFGEEPPLVGYYGSGTIFFTHCNLLCSFCQNYDISHEGRGEEVSDQELAAMMLRLQQMGCHNINFVTPSHVVPQIVTALMIAIGKGLSVPLVFNTSTYDKVETLKMIEGVFDIYMPDLKFFDKAMAQETCNAPDYPEIARAAIKEMHCQVGKLTLDDHGIAQMGLLIRHLVLPGCLEDTKKVLSFIYSEINPHTFVNIMPQYRPCGEAYRTESLSVPLNRNEYLAALQLANDLGLTHAD